MYRVEYVPAVLRFLAGIPEKDNKKIVSAVGAMKAGAFHKVYIKSIQPPIRELIVRNYRFLFFIKGSEMYFLNAFIKKTAKTPRKEIERAYKNYLLLK